jgi:hypothetical protein
LFFFFKKNKIKYVLGAFWEKKKAKGVELLQFESLGGLSVTFETLEIKVQIGGYFKGVKCNFY